jgi:uncharacterized radical SAM protein YgiQ
LYGNAERALVALAHRLARREPITQITDLRGTAFIRQQLPEDWTAIASQHVDQPGPLNPPVNPYAMTSPTQPSDSTPHNETQKISIVPRSALNREKTYIILPSFEQIRSDAIGYAHASRLLHLESNPHNARPLAQAHNNQWLWVNPPPWPLTTPEMDRLYELPYTRQPHPIYQGQCIPAYEMIRFSITIMRGCFGGCSFCSITEHEGRIIQNRSEDSIVQEIETIRDNVPGFTGIISDLGGPTANMYRLHCKSPDIEAHCRRLSCVYPGICKNLNTDHAPLIRLYRRARNLPGIKKILIASGLRYDLAVESPDYVKELVTHHVGGYLKIAPEHTESEPLSKMMKPGIGAYYRFKTLFDQYSKAAGKEQYLIPYFIAAHPGTTDEDMLNLALWLKRNQFRADQVQAFLPSPMALATAMYHSGYNPLQAIKRNSERIHTAKGIRARRLHKAFLRYHDPENWPLLREALKKMGRADLIGSGKNQLIPAYQPAYKNEQKTMVSPVKKPLTFKTQHTRSPNKSTHGLKRGK